MSIVRDRVLRVLPLYSHVVPIPPYLFLGKSAMRIVDYCGPFQIPLALQVLAIILYTVRLIHR